MLSNQKHNNPSHKQQPTRSNTNQQTNLYNKINQINGVKITTTKHNNSNNNNNKIQTNNNNNDSNNNNNKIQTNNNNDNNNNKRNKLKYIGTNTNKYYEINNIKQNKRINRTQQSRISVIKFYQIFNKQPSNITFGPDNFKIYGQSQIIDNNKNNNNPQHIIPITHKNNNNKQSKSNSKSKITINNSIVQNLKNRPKVYNIVNKQLGFSQGNINNMKEDALNYQLEKYLKRKGLDYLEQNKQKGKRIHTQVIQNKSRSMSQHQQIPHKQQKNSRLSKYPNYIPEVFPQIANKKSSKQAKSIEKQKNAKEKQSKELIKKAQSKKQIRLNLLNEKEQMLGKIVYDKVQDYFHLDKEKPNYFVRVQSQQKIDQAWVQYLKTKMDRADLMLNANKDKKLSSIFTSKN